MSFEQTFAQIEFLESLCLRAGLSRLQVGDVHTREDAGASDRHAAESA
jgi:hypothetical protein